MPFIRYIIVRCKIDWGLVIIINFKKMMQYFFIGNQA